MIPFYLTYEEWLKNQRQKNRKKSLSLSRLDVSRYWTTIFRNKNISNWLEIWYCLTEIWNSFHLYLSWVILRATSSGIVVRLILGKTKSITYTKSIESVAKWAFNQIHFWELSDSSFFIKFSITFDPISTKFNKWPMKV